MEDLNVEALEFYNKYKKDEEIFKIIQGREFVDTLSRLYKLVNKNDNKILVKTYKNIDEKRKIMEEKYKVSQYNFIVSSDKTEIIELYDSGRVAAYAFISYEDEVEFGKYAFLHLIGFTNSEYSKHYKRIENVIAQKSKNNLVEYMDRIISFQYDKTKEERALEEIKSMGYMCIWKNCKIEVDVKGYDNIPIIGDMKKTNQIDMDYMGIGKIIPSRFENKSNIYEGNLENGKFFVNLISREEKSFANIYIYNGKIDDKDYIKHVYELTFRFLSKHNINKLITFISPENIMLLRENVNFNVLQNIYWLRKRL